jgi:hypothetical protein
MWARTRFGLGNFSDAPSQEAGACMTPKVIILAMRCSLGCGIAILAAKASQAQWVNVTPGGGVQVRAPFVRVDVYEGGGVSVRAPFTSIDTPGRGPYHVERRAFVELDTLQWSSPAELARMDDQTLRQTLQRNAARLHQSLARFTTRASWQRYLRLPEDWMSQSSTQPDKQHEALAGTLSRFRFVAENPDYSMIARLPSFHATHDALNEIVSRLENSGVPRSSTEELPVPPQNPIDSNN